MAFRASIVIDGLDDVIDSLRALGNTHARQAMRRSLTTATTPVMKSARRMAPVETGALKKSIGRKVKTYRSTGAIFIAIGPRKGFKDPETGRNPDKYAHLVELGTSHSAAEPFLRPALEENRSLVEQRFRREIWINIEREAERLRKKQEAKLASQSFLRL